MIHCLIYPFENILIEIGCQIGIVNFLDFDARQRCHPPEILHAQLSGSPAIFDSCVPEHPDYFGETAPRFSTGIYERPLFVFIDKGLVGVGKVHSLNEGSLHHHILTIFLFSLLQITVEFWRHS